jgi:heat shock protein HtpX
MYSAIAKNKRNTILIIALFLVIIGGLGALTAWIVDNWWVAGITVAVAVIYAVIQYFAATSETLALTGAIEIQKHDNPRLYRIVENLAITEGMPTPRVYVINDPAPNAFATGRDPEHAVVAATTGLLEIMDDAELEGVMAHELGHVKNYDIRVSLIVFGLVIAIGLLADIALRMTIFGGRGRSNNNGGPAAIVMLVIGLVAAIIAPLIAGVVQAAVSRQREYLADATGAMTTRHPEALARALEKLQYYGRPVARTISSMSHLWISDPNKPGFMQRLFATHPPLADRIARLRANADRF